MRRSLAPEGCRHAPDDAGGTADSPIARSLPRTIRSLCPECLQTIPADGIRRGRARGHAEGLPDARARSGTSCSPTPRCSSGWRSGTSGTARGLRTPPGARTGRVRSAAASAAGTPATPRSPTWTSRPGAISPARSALPTPTGSPMNCPSSRPWRRSGGFEPNQPAPAFAVQFTGGEPTVHPRFLDIVASAKALGFSHIQVASNGAEIGRSGFRAPGAGCRAAVHLPPDGRDDRRRLPADPRAGTPGHQTRRAGVGSKAGLRVIFVPTIVRGVNDHQIGDLFRLAFEHLDVLSGISFQPMTFTGRVPEGDRLRLRFTLSGPGARVQRADRRHAPAGRTGSR